MRKGLFIFIMSLTAGTALSQGRMEQRLMKLFDEAEQCYLMDDYQQLHHCIQLYHETFKPDECANMDSVDIYRAYYYKMCGSYYYGWAENPEQARISEDYYIKSLNIFKQRVTNWSVYAMHRNEVTLHEELAQLYYKAKNYNKSLAHLDTLFVYLDNKSDIPSFLPEYYNNMSQRAMCHARLGHFDEAIALIEEAQAYFKQQKESEYYELQRRKGKILMLQADKQGTNNYKPAINCYKAYVNEQYSSIGQRLATMNSSQQEQYWLATHPFLYDCFRLGNLAPEMLYDLALFSKGYLLAYEHSSSGRFDTSKKGKRNAPTRWTQVKHELREKDCAIEFVQYFGRDDELRMGCLVLRNNSVKPLFIDLFATDSLLNLPLTASYTIGTALTAPKPAVKDTLYNYPLLSQLIWSPQLMTAIGNADRVFFAADGLIHQCAIEYLMPDSQKTCYRLTSTRNIRKNHIAPKLAKALICGGITYNETVTHTEGGNDIAAYRFLASNAGHISELPDARKEVDSIYRCRQNPLDTLLVGTSATDEAFVELLKKGYDVIHLSTHGFFGGRIGIHNDIKPLQSDESMSKSGLLFAGASSALADKSFDANLFDGVLSGTELSQLDFSKTELIVLSACETGLGHLTDDGVYGIQRALKQAGANAMMVSLWRVNDISCSLLMRYFYEALQQQTSHDIHAAFLNARNRLQQEERHYNRFDSSTLSMGDGVIKYDTPRHINPFIIIDAY